MEGFGRHPAREHSRDDRLIGAGAAPGNQGEAPAGELRGQGLDMGGSRRRQLPPADDGYEASHASAPRT